MSRSTGSYTKLFAVSAKYCFNLNVDLIEKRSIIINSGYYKSTKLMLLQLIIVATLFSAG